MARFSAIIPWAIFVLAGSALPAQQGQVLVPSRRAAMQQSQQQPMQPNMAQPQPGMPQPGGQVLVPSRRAAMQQGQPQTMPPGMAQPQPNMPQPGAVPGNAAQPPFQPGRPPTAPLKTAAPVAPTTPAVPPEVTYRDGMLTVHAANSTLGSVLTAIRSKSGIEFEGPENIQERVALSLGPAPAGEVLQGIFAGLKYDFVAIGRPDNPSIVQRVILTSQSQGGGEVAGAQPRPASQENPDEDTPDETPNAEPQDTAVQQPEPPPPAQAQPPQNQQPKTPEQLLQELQDMRKQQQMQQEGAPPANPNQVPRKLPPTPR